MADRCGHCGREGTLAHVEAVVLSSQSVEVIHHSGAGEFPQDVTEQYVLDVRRCSVCGQPTLATYFWVDEWSDPEDEPRGWRVIHPQQREPGVLPARVRDRYLEMLGLLYDPNAFAVSAGKLLEAVCTDQGVPRQGRSLASRLDELVAAGALPKPLADQARVVKDYRNIGGHDDDIAVKSEDVPLIRGFAESLLDFLYWGPANLELGREALQRRTDSNRET